MAPYSSSSFKNKITFTYAIPIILLSHASACFESIISFGDSLADTGNLLHLSPRSNSPPHFAVPPYGETFFHHPTGRFCDGRLIIDFLAEGFGIPLVPPFYGEKNTSSRSFGGGVNFAVGGSTALPDPFFVEKGVDIPYKNVSLAVQMSWFKQIFLPAFCRKPSNCKKILETSLVLVGEIGGNDYNHAFLNGKSLDVVQSFVPQVVKAISLTINELIKLGAVTLMVPGNLPIGCSASYLTYFNGSNEKEYDPETGCLNWPNKFSQHHNKLLQLELSRIRRQNPGINIIYADYYNAAMQVYRAPENYGFAKGALRACCGAGGPCNVNLALLCGSGGTTTCEDPSLHVSWDGLHLTEAAYRWIATSLLRGSFTIPQLTSVCAPSSIHVTGFSDH